MPLQSSPDPAAQNPSPVATRAAELATALGPLAGDFALDWVSECTSTNTALVDAPPADDGRIHVLVADRQRAGRGRRGRQWLSWEGASLTFSTLWRFSPGAPAPAGLSLVAGLALARALEQLGVQGVQLKWPNDVLVHGNKLAGILIDLLPGRGRPPAAVIGIGLNLRLPDAHGIENQTGVTDLAQALECVPPAPAGFPALRGAWQQRNAFADLPVRIVSDQDVRIGICAGVDDDGALLLRTDTGMQRILAGDVSLRPLTGDAA